MPHSRLGSSMLRRRGELGLSVAGATELAGISRSTWHALERAKRTTALPRTFAGVDRALRWLPGNARDLFDGTIDEPVPVHEEWAEYGMWGDTAGRGADPEVAALLVEIEADLVLFDADELRVILLEIKRRLLRRVGPQVPGVARRWPQERRRGDDGAEDAPDGPPGPGRFPGTYLDPGDATPRAS